MELEPGQQLELNVDMTASGPPPGWHIIPLLCDQDESLSLITWDGPDNMDIIEATANIDGLNGVYNYDYSKYYIPDFVTSELKVLTYGEQYWISTSHSQDWRVPDYEPPPPPPTDYLKMTKSQLFTYLTNGQVAADWWDLSFTDRLALAHRVIEWWSFPIKAYCAVSHHEGKPTTNPYHDEPLPRQYSCECYCEMNLRYYLIGSNQGVPDTAWWWDQNKDVDGWMPFDPGHCFYLPVDSVSISKGTFGHWICALQVQDDKLKWAAWVFFNLDEIVTAGNERQMPYGSSVSVFGVEGVRADGNIDLETNPFVTFEV